MSRKVKAEAEKTRARILASALALFAKNGYERTTFTDIAARLKMTKGAVYWHFESKERLLVELVDAALAKFRRQLEELMPHGELSFPKVADMMVRNALQMVDDPKVAAFFRLMKCQIRWADDSMAKVRENLISDERLGPLVAFRNAVAADIAAGRARGRRRGRDRGRVNRDLGRACSGAHRPFPAARPRADAAPRLRGDLEQYTYKGVNHMAEEKGSTLGSIIATAVLAAVCVAGGWIAKDMCPKGAGDDAAARAAQAAAMAAQQQTVAVTNAEMRVYNLPERFVAHAEAVQEVDLLPQIDGYVKEVKFKEGDVVKAGQLLYVIDDERYQAVAGQRKADLAAAEAEKKRAERYFRRMQEADARGITQLERDNAEAAALKADAAVKQAEANLVVAEYDLKKTHVTAPISGQIGKSAAHVGDYVSPQKGALAKIVQIDPIRVSFPLTDRAYVAWRQAQRAGTAHVFRMRLVLPDGSEYDQTGKWDFDDNQMSRETASIMMRLSFPNPERLLVPNSYVTLLADYETPPSYPSVPQQCLIDLPGGNRGVWVVRDDLSVEQRAVEAKEAFEGWTPIVSGLAAGERVVLSGTAKALGPGVKVALVEPTSNDDINPAHKAPIEE